MTGESVARIVMRERLLLEEGEISRGDLAKIMPVTDMQDNSQKEKR